MSKVIKARVIRVNPDIVTDAGLDVLDVSQAGPMIASAGEVGATREDPIETARSLLERAEQVAKKRLDAAERESERIREEAHALGYRDGAAAARSEVLEEARPLLGYLRDLGQILSRATEEAVKAAEDAIGRLAIEVAEKVIRHQVSMDGSIVLDMVRESIRRASVKGEVRLRVSAWDLDRVRDFKEDLLRMADEATGIEIVEDPRVEPGGCIVETAFGCVDARPASQLREIGRAFFGNGHDSSE